MRIYAGGGKRKESFTVVGFPGCEAQNMDRVDEVVNGADERSYSGAPPRTQPPLCLAQHKLLRAYGTLHIFTNN